MKAALLAVVAVLLIAGGAGGTYLFLKNPAEAAVGKTAEHQAAKDVQEDRKEYTYVKIDPLSLPIIDETGVSQVVSLVVVLEVEDEDKAKAIGPLMPRLQDAYIQHMYGILNRQAVMNHGVLQIGPIKNHMNEITNKVLGAGTVNDVLLQVVNQRSL